MASERANDPQAFKGFIDEQLARGGADLTLDEVLAHWEYENQAGAEREAIIQAIREGLDDRYAGRIRSAEEVLAELRRKFRLDDQ